MYFLESVRDPEMRDVIDMGVRVIRPGQSQPLPRPSDKLRVAACFRTEENDIVLSTCTLGVLSMDDAAPSSGSSSTRDLSLGQPSSSQQSNPFSRAIPKRGNLLASSTGEAGPFDSVVKVESRSSGTRTSKDNDTSKLAWIVTIGALLSMMICQGLLLVSALIVTQVDERFGKEHHTRHVWLSAAATGLPLFTGPIFGSVLDDFGPMPLLGFAIASQAGFFVALGFCTSFPSLVGIFALHGLGCGALINTGSSIPSKLFEKKLGLAQGLFMAGPSLSGIIFSAAIPKIYASNTWVKANAVMAVVAGGIGILSSICVLGYKSVLPDAARPEEGKHRENLKKDLLGYSNFSSLLRRKTWADNEPFVWFIGGMFWLELGLFGVSATIPFVADSMEVAQNHRSTVLMAMSVASMVGRVCSGLISDKVGQFQTLLCAGIITILNTFSFYEWVTRGGLSLFYYAVVSWGLLSGSWIPLFGSCIRLLVPVKENGKFLGVSSFAMAPSCCFAAPVLQAVLDASYAGGMFAFVGFTILCGMSSIFMAWRSHEIENGVRRTWCEYCKLPYGSLCDLVTAAGQLLRAIILAL